jgi:hypothetical protein
MRRPPNAASRSYPGRPRPWPTQHLCCRRTEHCLSRTSRRTWRLNPLIRNRRVRCWQKREVDASAGHPGAYGTASPRSHGTRSARWPVERPRGRLESLDAPPSSSV